MDALVKNVVVKIRVVPQWVEWAMNLMAWVLGLSVVWFVARGIAVLLGAE